MKNKKDNLINALRELNISTAKNNRITHRSNIIMIILTVILVILTVILIFIAVAQIPPKPKIEIYSAHYFQNLSGEELEEFCKSNQCKFKFNFNEMGFDRINKTERYFLYPFYLTNNGKSTEDIHLLFECGGEVVGVYGVNLIKTPPLNLISSQNDFLKADMTLDRLSLGDLVVAGIIQKNNEEKSCEFIISSNDIQQEKKVIDFDGLTWSKG